MTANSNTHSDEIELHSDEWFLAFGAVGYLKSSQNHLYDRNATLFIQGYHLLLVLAATTIYLMPTAIIKGVMFNQVNTLLY